MSDLRDRMTKEADFAAKLSRLTSRQKREARELLGNPPRPDRITEDDWKRWEDQRRGLLIVLLLLLADDSATQHSREINDKFGGDGLADFSTEARKAADQWATKHGREVAAEQIKNAREYYADLINRWREFPDGVPPEEFERGLVNLFGPANDERTAATETTAANSAGVRAARGAATKAGVRTRVTWWTEDDDRVCAVCGPLHGQPQEDWAEIIRGTDAPNWLEVQAAVEQNEGPPAHKHCRCWPEIEVLK